jgi:cobalamin biosynthesis Mg chelatase CobN
LAAVLSGVAALVGLALSAGVASASSDHPRYLAPPGNPAVMQYTEDVPNAMGSSPPRSGGNPPSSLTPAEREKLNHLGANGKALANVVEETAPPPAQPASSAAAGGAGTAAATTTASSGAGSSSSAGSSSNAGSPRAGSSSGAANQPGTGGSAQIPPPHSLSSTGSGSSVSAVLSAATGQGGGGGMGIFLPLLMAAGLVAVVVAVWRRRGTRGS